MKRALLVISLAATTALLPTWSHADLTFNAGAVTDYRYRGISQTNFKPALQGGVDFSQGPFYLGAWASSIKWIHHFNGGADVELDLYGGVKGELSKGLGYDVGVLAYIYPSNHLSPNANTTELYGALSFGPVTAKYSHALSNTFGNPDSKNSGYLDLSASFELGDGWTLAPHLGHQRIAGPVRSAASYTDYSLSLSKDFNGIVPSLALVGTDADKGFYVPGPAASSTKFLGKTALVLGVKVNF